MRNLKIDNIWHNILTAIFIVFVFLLETTIKPTNESPSLDQQTILKLLFFYGSALFVLVKFKLKFIFNFQLKLFFLYIFYLAVSSAWSSYSLVSLAYSGIWMVFILLVVRLVSTQDDVSKLTWMFYLSLSAISIISLTLYFIGYESAFFSEEVTSSISVIRLKGLTGSPTTIGNISGLLFILSTNYYFIDKLRSKIVIISGFSSILVLAMSYSRTSIAASFICSLYLVFFLIKNRLFKIILLVIGVLSSLFLLLNVINPNVEAVTKSGNLNEIFTLMGRTTIWVEAIDNIKERFFFGGGLGSARWIMASNYFEYGRTYTTSHNFILESLIENGLVGTIILMIVLVSCIYSLFKNSKLDGRRMRLYFILFLYLLVVGLTEKSFVGPLNVKSAALMLVLIYASVPLKGISLEIIPPIQKS